MQNCPVCHEKAVVANSGLDDLDYVKCPNCGVFEIPHDLPFSLPPERLPRLSHKIWRMQSPGSRVKIDDALAQRLTSDPLPSIREQMDNFILWVGDALRETNPVGDFQLGSEDNPRLFPAIIGAYDSESAWDIAVKINPSEGLVEAKATSTAQFVSLTPKGWDRYEELKRSTVESRLAFMAMPFNDKTLDRVFEKCFKPAVAATGFELRRVIDGQKAGVIDDQMRVAIRRARFTIAELTDGNRGAYWEAGFAEGLNRPVIYTCEKGYFDNPDTNPHFDINHCSTVIWKEDELERAAEELKDRIRATLPDEAKMND